MEEYLKIGLIVIGIILIICLAPMLFLWSINSLAELGGADFYIEHSLWSYFVAFVFLVIMKVENSSS